ncbi:hypothetical protein GCM10008967_43350 [Bacillus carboniphilus]|uniref:Uncharacterized protein n=1 Tax=Bacillus carboniphilus TaxID=86663 RepID=A0ABP3GKT6_9BACI
MRWMIKRPARDQISTEIDDVISILSHDRFIWIDILFYSFIFCLFLTAVIPSIFIFFIVFAVIFTLSSVLFLTCKHFYPTEEDG